MDCILKVPLAVSLSKFAGNLESNFVTLVGKVDSGNGRIDGLGNLVTNVDGSLNGSKEVLSMLVLIELEVVVLRIEVDVLVFTPPFFAFFVLFVLFMLFALFLLFVVLLSSLFVGGSFLLVTLLLVLARSVLVFLLVLLNGLGKGAGGNLVDVSG